MPWSKEDVRYGIALAVAFAIAAWFIAGNFGLVPSPLPEPGRPAADVRPLPPGAEPAPSPAPGSPAGPPPAGAPAGRTRGGGGSRTTAVTPAPGGGGATPPPPQPTPVASPRQTPGDLPCALLGIC